MNSVELTYYFLNSIWHKLKWTPYQLNSDQLNSIQRHWHSLETDQRPELFSVLPLEPQ